MALSIQFAKYDIAKKAASITFKDSTGVYDSDTNPGGYGVPNFGPPTQGFLLWRYWTDTIVTSKYLTAANIDELLASILASTGLTVTPEFLGLSTQPGKFSDGVHQVQYIPLKDAAVTATFTNGSKVVVLTTNDFDIRDWGETVGVFISGSDTGDFDTNKTGALEVDWDETNDDVQLTLTEEYTGDTGTYELFYGPMKDIKVLVNKAAEECIVKMIGSVAVTQCICETQRSRINQFIQWRFAADVQFDCEDFDGAHNLINEINKYCQSGTCTIC